MTSICPVWVELVRDPSRWGTISIATNVNEAKSVRGKCLYALTNIFSLLTSPPISCLFFFFFFFCGTRV
jgi:hypothetical protein